MLRIETFTGAAMRPHIPALARLRRIVFREWPYLYDDGGREAYETGYLETYAASPGAALVVARDGTEPVGLATCLPLADETPNVVEPLRTAGLDLAAWCYFGEGILLKPYRGQGAGVAFYQAREAHARSLGLRHTTFCAVTRPDGHPMRPADAVPLDGFWRNRGYTMRPGLTCIMRWPDLGGVEDNSHTMQFWTKDLDGAA